MELEALAERVAILADDLTGALDAAAAFAAGGTTPVDVVWGDHESRGGVGFAVDSETRQAPAGEAGAIVAGLLSRLEGASPAFKKIDSLLRGNTLAEIAVCAASRRFGSVVVAPAFPANGRITSGGRQLFRGRSGWEPADGAIDVGLQARSIPAALVPRGKTPVGSGTFVCDAETETDLAGLADAVNGLAPPVLWCGSAGLARVLADRHGAIRLPITLPAGGTPPRPCRHPPSGFAVPGRPPRGRASRRRGGDRGSE